MSELLRTQRALQTHLLDKNASCVESTLDELIVDTERVARAVRLNVYANGYRSRIVEALSVDFSGLHAYLGDESFIELVHAYIARYPSHYFSLRNVGGKLAEFLKITPPYAEHVELHELAIFEWALCHAFDAADSACIDAGYFSAMPPQQWPEITLRFSPSLTLVMMRSNAPAIWKSLNAEQAPPEVKIAENESTWLVWRRDLTILFRPLDAIEKVAIDSFLNGKAFADVCEKFAEMLLENEVPVRAVAILQQWLTDQLIVAP